MAEVLEVIQGFDPPGVAARDLRECLLIQVKRLSSENQLVIDIIDRLDAQSAETVERLAAEHFAAD